MPVMHMYVEARLGRWGLYQRWLRFCETSMMPSCAESNFDMIMGARSGGYAPPPIPPCPVDQDEAQKTFRCVAVLKEDRREIISELYIFNSRPVDIIKAMGCGSRQTYYNQLYTAYAELLAYFNDIEAGIPLPPIASSPMRGRTTRLGAMILSRKYA
jgi:hypothetical protein